MQSESPSREVVRSDPMEDNRERDPVERTPFDPLNKRRLDAHPYELAELPF